MGYVNGTGLGLYWWVILAFKLKLEINTGFDLKFRQVLTTFRHCTVNIQTGPQIFFKIGGPKWPMEQKMVGHFLKWWAQAYQTNHSWYLSSILYLHTDTDTFMHICMLTADYTVKPVLRGRLKRWPIIT